MAVVKVYCTNCGQRVSGDETFYGTIAHCPACHSEIHFPKAPAEASPSRPPASPMPSSGIIPPPPGPAAPAASAEAKSVVSKPFAGGGVTTPMPRHPNLRTPLIGSPPGGGSLPPAQPLPAAGAPQSAPASSPTPAGMPGAAALPPGEPAKLPPFPRPDAVEPGEGAPDSGVMPLLVLGSGIASLVLCSGFLVLSAVAIVGGHLTMMRLDEAGIREGRNKVVAGTLLGYVSVFLFLVAAIVAKLAWPAIQKMIHAG